MEDTTVHKKEFKQKYWYVAKLIFLLGAVVISTFFLPDLLFLIFGGILFSIFLSCITNYISEKLHIKYGLSLITTLLFFILISSIGGYFLAPALAEQFDELVENVPKAFTNLTNRFSHYSWFQYVMDEAEPKNLAEKSSTIFKNASLAFTSFLGWMGNFVIIMFIGLYCAAEPKVYKSGFLHLFPKERRSRLAKVIDRMDDTLKWWLVGKFFGMAVIGILTMIGLYFLDVPLAFALALLAALLTFIPNIGPILAAIPAVLLGFLDSPHKALYIALLYIGIQTVESYVLTPLVQRKTISLPPALTLSAQVILGFSIGGLGVAFAAPFTAAAMIAIQMLYVEDILHDPIQLK